MDQIPNIWVEEVVDLNDFDGTVSDGTVDPVAPGSPAFKGRVHRLIGGTKGGLIEANPISGMTLEQLCYRDDAGVTTEFLLQLVDSDGFAYTLLRVANKAEVMYDPARPVFVPPGWALRVKTTGNGAAGKATRFWAKLSGGWPLGGMSAVA